MPITSSAINLREVVCRVYKREKDRVERTWRRACLLGAQERGDQRWHNPSDEERSTFQAVGNDKAPLDAVVKDERLRMIVHMNGWYERARTEVRKQESKDLRRSPFKKTTWEVMRDAFVEAARQSAPGFWRDAGEDLDDLFREYCEWLVTGEGTPDAKTHEAFGILDGLGFRDELWTRLDNECREEARDIGLGGPPGGGQSGEGAAPEQNTGPLVDPIPIVKVVELVGHNAGRSDKLAERMKRLGYRLEQKARKWHCERADAIRMFPKHKQRIQGI